MIKYELITKFTDIKLNEPLGKYVQNKVGGPAEMLYIAKTRENLINIIKEAKDDDIPVTI